MNDPEARPAVSSPLAPRAAGHGSRLKAFFFRQRPPLAVLAAISSALLATAVCLTVFGPARESDVVMIYLLGVVLVSLRFGYAPSLLAAVLSVCCFDFFFVPPLYTLAVHDWSHVVTFGVMFVVAWLISGLTQRVRAQTEAARRAELKVETEQMRSSLLSSVSHDLRTPLAVMTGAASTLLEDAVDARTRRELTESILQEALRLNRLVRNLLDMTRLEAGAVRVRKEWQPLEEVVGSALNRMEDALAGRPIRIALGDDLPLVPLDAVLIEQVIVNLLENAVKYSPPHSEIELRAHTRSGAVELFVADRGPGIPERERARIFDKFYRLDNAHGAGVGLGLAICRGVVMAHGGSLAVTNRVGGGAEFCVRLPLDGPPQNVEGPDPQAET